MVRFPSPELEGEGVITEVLGPRGQPGVDTLMVLRAYNIPDEFDDDVLAEAREQARHFDEEDVEGRVDLRDAPDRHHRPAPPPATSTTRSP